MKLQYLVPSSFSLDLWQKLPPLPCFQNSVLELIDELSGFLLTSKTPYSDNLKALGFWLRRAHIQEIQNDYSRRINRSAALGGIFHVAPSNVDTMFVYSWIVSLLLGNKNIVRISRAPSSDKDNLLSLISRLFTKTEYHKIATRNAFLSYNHDDQINLKLSNMCQARVIWGSDQTIDTFIRLPLEKETTDILFRDKFSLCLLDASQLVQERSRTAELFCADIIAFDQQACSSPKAVIWINSQENRHNIDAFWRACGRFYSRKNTLSPQQHMQSFTNSQLICSRLPNCNYHRVGKLSLLTLPYLSLESMEDHKGNGLILQIFAGSLHDLQKIANQKTQTLTTNCLNDIHANASVMNWLKHSFDRIVPLGRALHFETRWDGYDMLSLLCLRT